MKRSLALLLILMFGGLVFAQDTEPPVTTRNEVPSPDDFEFQVVMQNLWRPLYVTHAGDGTERLFIVEQGGIIYVLDGGESTIFLD
ncbi:MAG: hypothetical protein Q9P01_06440, partial [Anaerolineae bacterium]|nr:hypothetical protein [Anaerolineae bacterium]